MRAMAAPVRLAVVELAARAAMHSHHLHAGLFGAAGKQGRIERIFVPAETHLYGDRHIDRTDDRVDQRQRMIEVEHQSRPGIAARHLLGRTTHVDVDDVGALAHGDARGFGHVRRFPAGKLDHMDRQAGMADADVEAGPALGQFAARDHFGHDQSCAMLVGAFAKRFVCNAGHRRQKHAIADFDAAYLKRFGQNGHITHAQKPSRFPCCIITRQVGIGAQRAMTSH